MRPVYKYPAIAVAALFIFALSLFILFSGSHLEKVLREELEEHSRLSFIAKEFSRSFPLGFKAKGVTLSTIKEDTVNTKILELKDIRGSLAIFPLIIGNKDLTYQASFKEGRLTGNALLKEETEINLEASNVALSAFMPLRALVGVKDGNISGRAAFTFGGGNCPKGFTNLDVMDVNTKELISPYPSMLFGEKISGSLSLETTPDCKAEIKGLFIEGESINAKLKGVVTIRNPFERSAVNMKIELFIKPGQTAKETNRVLSILERYKRPSGSYLMSLKGTIGKPLIREVAR